MIEKDIITREYNHEEVLFREGDKTYEMYIIMSGYAKVTKFKKNTKELMELGVLGPGQMIGEMSLISHEPRSATVQAEGKLIVKIVTEDTFKKGTAGVAPWVMCLARVVAKRLRNINDSVEDIMQSKAEGRPKVSREEREDMGASEFDINSDPVNPGVLYVNGYFFEEKTEKLSQEINKLVRQKQTEITLDFSDTIDTDQEAIKFLVSELERLKNAGIRLHIQNVQLIHSKITNNKILSSITQALVPPLQTVAPKKYLIKQGEESDYLYIVESGRFEVFRSVGDQEKSFARIGVGDVIGEMALISEGTRTASVKSLTTSKVYRINAKDIELNRFQIPRWFLTVLKQMVFRVRAAIERFDQATKL